MTTDAYEIARDPSASPEALTALFKAASAPRSSASDPKIMELLLVNPQLPAALLHAPLQRGVRWAWANPALPLHALAGDLPPLLLLESGALHCGSSLLSTPASSLRGALESSWAPLYEQARRGSDGPMLWSVAIYVTRARSPRGWTGHRERVARILALLDEAMTATDLADADREAPGWRDAHALIQRWATPTPGEPPPGLEAEVEDAYQQIDTIYMGMEEEHESTSTLLTVLRDTLVYIQDYAPSNGISIGSQLAMLPFFTGAEVGRPNVGDPSLTGGWLADRVRHELPTAAELLR